MDELFEALTLIQTQKVRNFPIVIMGKPYWTDLCDFIHGMVREGTIAERDLDLILFTDSIEEAIAHLQEYGVQQFGLRRKRVPKSNVLLGERGIEPAT